MQEIQTDEGVVPPKFERRLVSFIDILGFKDAVEKLERKDDPDRLERTLSVLRFMNAQTNDGYYGDDLPIIEIRDVKAYQHEMGDLRFLYASDCMVISAEDSPQGLKALCYRIHKIAADLAWDGFFVRGGITAGSIVHKDRIVFGSPYHRAICLEKRAVYPRVIFDPDVAVAYARSFPFGTVEVRKGNGYSHLSPFPFRLYPPYVPSWEVYLRRVLQHTQTGYANASAPRIAGKYSWLMAEGRDILQFYIKQGMLNEIPGL